MKHTHTHTHSSQYTHWHTHCGCVKGVLRFVLRVCVCVCVKIFVSFLWRHVNKSIETGREQCRGRWAWSLYWAEGGSEVLTHT